MYLRIKLEITASIWESSIWIYVYNLTKLDNGLKSWNCRLKLKYDMIFEINYSKKNALSIYIYLSLSLCTLFVCIYVSLANLKYICRIIRSFTKDAWSSNLSNFFFRKIEKLSIKCLIVLTDFKNFETSFIFLQFV